MSASATAQLTAKIVAIDHDSRTVTLQDDKGEVSDFQAGPEVKRFDALKVGDTVTFTYQESVALAIAKTNAPMPSAVPSPVVTRFEGSKPGGQISRTLTTTVTIESIDTSKPSVTVKTQDGRSVSFLVQDKSILNGVKPGDVVQITYSQALMITVK
jgi:Cu/Ag efflux protein CusF